jgi:hypothetical protein
MERLTNLQSLLDTEFGNLESRSAALKQAVEITVWFL